MSGKLLSGICYPLSALLILVNGALAAGPLVGPGRDNFDRETGEYTELNRSVNYELFRPPGHDQPGKLPLTVYLHGYTDGQFFKQERLNDTMRDLVHATQRDNAMRGDVCTFANLCSEFDDDFASYLLVPKIPIAQGWWNYERHVLGLIGEVSAQYQVDTDRVYLTGYSNGAVQMPNIILRGGPGVFAAGVPVSGGLNNAADSLVGAMSDVPTWFFHGNGDNVLAPGRSVDLSDRLNAAGGDSRLTLVDGGHNAGYEFAYRDPNNELYPWMFSQTNAVPEPSTNCLLLLGMGWLAVASRNLARRDTIRTIR